MPPVPGAGRVFRSVIVETYPPFEPAVPAPLLSRLIRLQNRPIAERYEQMLLTLRRSPSPSMVEPSLLLSYFVPYSLESQSVRDDLRRLIAATPPTADELRAIARALGRWILSL